MTEVRVTTTGLAAGGDAIARLPDGRVVFVEGALPGETVAAVVVGERPDFARARVIAVETPSPDRVAPPCAAFAAGCGGCPWQHVAPAAQPAHKAGIVRDALRRIARLAEPPVLDEVRAVPPWDYRTTVSLAVTDGRLGFHRRRGHDVVAASGCLVTHPMLAEIVDDGRFPAADGVLLRGGVATGERIAVVAPRVRSDTVVPVGVHVVSRADGAAVRAAAVHEDVAGRRWRVSANSFFQSGPAAAELLVDAVGAAAGDGWAGRGAAVVDAYAGVGLLGGTVAARAEMPLVAIESNRAAAGDARHNLRSLPATVVAADVAEWSFRATPATPRAGLVIADPARPGLGRSAAAALAGAGAPVLVLVSCDPASLARDTNLLAGHGYRLRSVRVLDLFPQTFHVEAVARFER